LLKTNVRLPIILVIEDDINQRKLLETTLTSFDMVVVTAEDGTSALRWLADHKPDIVLLDYMLPDFSGVAVCQQIRQKYSLTVLPVLMISAVGDQAETRVSGLEAGANDFMAKPYNLKELILRIQGLLKSETEIHTGLLFSRYITKVMRNQAEFHPGAMHQRQQLHAAILFADLRGFTHMSHAASSSQILSVLDSFFEVMLTLIDANGGSVFELIGDELLAAFGVSRPDPTPSISAMQTALKMRKHFDTLKQKWSAGGLKVGMGIGIHRGEVMLGNVGSIELTRYTIVGSPVNMTHRLVDLADDGEIIVSDEVYSDISSMHQDTEFQTMHNVLLKGLDEPITAYLVRQPGSLINSIRSLNAEYQSVMANTPLPDDGD
jgi:class 3 adenylate cyclase/ActR/RegA family two-component response regulator